MKYNINDRVIVRINDKTYKGFIVCSRTGILRQDSIEYLVKRSADDRGKFILEAYLDKDTQISTNAEDKS